MWLIKTALMFGLRQIRWVIGFVAFGAASVVFKILSAQDMIMLPGMEEAYQVDTTDPYIAAAIVFLVISRSLKKISNRFITNVGAGFDRLRSSD
ncbi:MAG: hypothetical protein HOC63_01080 [Rhodospirillales bacterium]|mgnify:CR=1 FL=1|jgi:hypothetical protein|nr:hypothetical protein [Rhodospirillales bacterium]MBT4039650.1 hypothetical protein [Rhodospirillales bacterium]MBT4625255.1 hypothetical protein [Rhodospirillales bacterium]MBT5352528.1 hypothetical protein [Rhodospirillales bacterium]MBT5519508.1 hypothetical protein [Rhodospirillales bacterium]